MRCNLNQSNENMSEDEEVVNKDNELYKHLHSLGFTEFETFDCKGSFLDQEESNSSLISSDLKTHSNELTHPTLSNHIKLSVHVHQTILTIISSKLLFVEDIELLESLVSNSSIQNYQSMNIFSIAGSASLCLASLVLYYKIEYLSQLPLYLTGLCSLFCLWQCQKVYLENSFKNLLNSHIESLKELCISIQKTYRFLKETEILATGKVSTQNVHSAMFIKTSMNSEDTKQLSPWKLLPQLRKSLVVALHETVKILVLYCSSFSKHLPSWIKIKQRINQSDDVLEKLGCLYETTFLESDIQISIRTLQSFIELYLDVQSEYLKMLACCLIPQHLCQRYSMGALNYFKFNDDSCRIKPDVLKILSSAQSFIIQTYVKLKLEYDIHSKFSRSAVNIDIFPKTNRLNHLQVQLHNIYLVLELMLLRIGSLEDEVEKLQEKVNGSKDEIHFQGNLTKELGTVRTDFQLAMKEFDHIYNHLVPSNPTTRTSPISKKGWENQSNENPKPISTGVLLGVSDFSINNSDEFFLAAAGSNAEGEECPIDDFEIETISKMPKTLISELSMTLKSVRKQFRARERQALERLGLDGVENIPSDDDDDNDNIRLTKKKKCKSSIEDCSDSMVGLRSKVYQENLDDNTLCEEVGRDRSSDHQSELIVTNDILSPFPSTSSIASLVAMKSKMWGNQSEECFADE